MYDQINQQEWMNELIKWTNERICESIKINEHDWTDLSVNKLLKEHINEQMNK